MERGKYRTSTRLEMCKAMNQGVDAFLKVTAKLTGKKKDYQEEC